MSDFVINAGIRFHPQAIDVSAISKAITNAAASASISVGKLSISKDIKGQIQSLLSDVQLRLSDKNISLGISNKIGNQIASIIQGAISSKPLKLQINPEYLRNQIDAVIKGLGSLKVQIGATGRVATTGKAGVVPGVNAGATIGAIGGGGGGISNIDKIIAKREAAIAQQIQIEERRLLQGEVTLSTIRR